MFSNTDVICFVIIREVYSLLYKYAKRYKKIRKMKSFAAKTGYKYQGVLSAVLPILPFSADRYLKISRLNDINFAENT